MPTPLASPLAVAYSAVVRYAAEKEMSTLDAMVKSARDGERNGDALPRKVLADYLEENPQHLHDDDTLTHLRSESHEHENGLHIYHDRRKNRIGAEPQKEGSIELRTVFDANGWPDAHEPWTVADDQPQIDVDGEDLAVLLHDGVALWGNSERRWRELTPHELPRVTGTLRDRGRDKQADILGDWMRRWWDVADADETDE